jgi:hypothetical protein
MWVSRAARVLRLWATMLATGKTGHVALAAAAIAICLSVHARAETNNDDDELREDVLFCEDALGHLAQCCGGFDVHAVPCHYHDDRSSDGCVGSSSTDKESPAFSLSESRCIRAASCDTLNVTGVCARAQAATAYTQTSSATSGFLGPTQTTGTESSHAPVCP